MVIVLFDWQSPNVPDISTLARGMEIDTILAASGNFGIGTLPVTGGDIFVSGQNINLYAGYDINLKGRMVFDNNRLSKPIIKLMPAGRTVVSTEEGELAYVQANSNPTGGIGKILFNFGSGIAPLAAASGYFFAYDNVLGNAGVTIGAAATIIGFNTEVVKDCFYQHQNTAAASGIITVTQDGLYKISYCANFTKTDVGTTVPTQVKSQLFKNGIAYNPSVSYDINANNTNNIFTCNADTFAILSAGDQITLRALKLTNTGAVVRTNNNEVFIMLERLR